MPQRLDNAGAIVTLAWACFFFNIFNLLLLNFLRGDETFFDT